MVYRVKQIQEDLDFGCEERSDNNPVLAVVTLIDENGDFVVRKFQDQQLMDDGIRIGDRVVITEGDLKKEETTRKHLPEQVIFMNMCMVCRGDEVLALDKVNNTYTGTTFPGGHVEAGETFHDAVVREIREETGLQIQKPVLKGIYHWYRDGFHNVGYLYRADQFDGEIISSEEGRVYWISRAEYEKKDLAVGMRRVLQLMDSDEFSECFMDVKEDGSIEEHMA